MTQEAEYVTVKIRSITAQKNDESSSTNTPVIFNFNVNIEEVERNNDSVKLNFQMDMEADPSIVKFSIAGITTVTGDSASIESILTADPDTNVPPVFTKIYQQAYAVMFLLAGTLNVPYPSPALLKRAHVQTALAGEIQE